MAEIIGNPELSFVFEEEGFSKKRKKSISFKNKEKEDLIKLYDSYIIRVPVKGEVVSARYEGQSSGSFVFSVKGFKDDIRVENKVYEAKYIKNLNVGDFIDVLISDIDQQNYLIKGSIAELYESRAHKNLKSLEEGQPIEAFVKSINPAGYDVELNYNGVTLPGFMPNTLAGVNKLHDPNSIVGKTFEVMIELFSEDEGTYIVSRRKYLQSLIPTAISQLEYGEVYTGHVTGTTPFGVFVEFNECLTGMIHKANLNPDWREKIASIKPGFSIEFYIKEVIKDKIILTQVLRESLWDTIKNGQVLNGTVMEVKQFGTLVNLDDETVGLIHTSEMEKLGKKFTVDQEVKVKVLSIDRMNRKIFLTVV
jgi:ribosomal protein S1